MALGLKQQLRIAELKTPLGKDKLVLTRFDGSEGLGELFTYNIEALSATEITDFDKALGSKCTVSIKIHDKTRHFNGVLVEAQWLGMRENSFCYRLVLRPWLWLLSRASDCRIFADMTAKELILEIFAKHADFATKKDKLTRDYKKLEYYVQYRETDLNFVTRIMEEFGMYYFFEHQDGDHTLVLADAKSSHSTVPAVPYRMLVGKQQRKEEHLSHWVPGRRFNTGKVVLNDYDYFKPSASLVSESESASKYQNSKLEVYDYPGRYLEKSDGEKYAKVRLEAEQASDNRCQGAGSAASLYPGALVSLEEHPTGSQNKQYLVVRAMHSLSAETYRSGAPSDSDETYSGRYEFLPSDQPYRSPMLTPKPVVRGPQTAKVVGKGEIDVDEHGRIIVQFHWDRNKDKSRRVRIGQVWSGKKWGGIFIPRVGMEVIVEFLEGDPDQPLVVGTVYNEEYKPPYDLPDDKTIAGWKSETSEGGGGYNELVFDDRKTGQGQLIRIHAEKDRKTHVKNDHDEYIGNKMTVEAKLEMKLIVGQSSIVMKPESITIKSPKITIKADMILDASSPKTSVTGDVTLTLKGGMIFIN
jgi:type VI secretion system secreted protein VgrG